MHRRSHLIYSALALAAGSLLSTPLLAADAWPSKPIRLIVPYPPGGTTDLLGRLVTDGLATRLGRTAVVENRSGAAGIVGSDIVAKAAPDGHTLLANFSPPHSVLKALYPRLPFDPFADFAAVGTAAATCYILVVHPDFPAKSVPELIAYARSQPPGSLSFASNGAGSAQHLLGELFKRLAGVDMVHVVYRGSAQSQADLLAGRVSMAFDNVAVMLPLVRRGAMRGLANTSPQRLSQAPDLPTMTELGFAQAESEAVFVLLAPAATPSAAISRLNAAMTETVKDAGFVRKLDDLSIRPLASSPAEATALMRRQEAQLGKLIQEIGISLE